MHYFQLINMLNIESGTCFDDNINFAAVVKTKMLHNLP